LIKNSFNPELIPREIKSGHVMYSLSPGREQEEELINQRSGRKTGASISKQPKPARYSN
jgi:hypothetical protein